MGDGARFPTLEEFWRRLDERDLEPDLRAELRARIDREAGVVERVGDPSVVEAFAARVLPFPLPPRALAVFLDEHFDRQLGRGDEREGVMPRDLLTPTGFRVLDEAARTRHGVGFARLPAAQQDALLGEAEDGNLQGPEGFDSSQWFKRTAQLLMLGYGSDPRAMVYMGYPGPPYKPGHIWLDRREVASRAARKRGYRTL